MQDWLLAAAVAATFVFGWFLMKWLDRFLEHNLKGQETQLDSSKEALRIGFSDPSVADSITNVLETYSKRCPSVPVCLFQGRAEELVKQFSGHKLNVLFLHERACFPADTHYDVREVLLSRTPVVLKYGGLLIEPITSGYVVQNVLWTRESKAAVSCFITCLEEEFDLKKLQT